MYPKTVPPRKKPSKPCGWANALGPPTSSRHATAARPLSPVAGFGGKIRIIDDPAIAVDDAGETAPLRMRRM
jgi:hypothetical protein